MAAGVQKKGFDFNRFLNKIGDNVNKFGEKIDKKVQNLDAKIGKNVFDNRKTFEQIENGIPLNSNERINLLSLMLSEMIQKGQVKGSTEILDFVKRYGKVIGLNQQMYIYYYYWLGGRKCMSGFDAQCNKALNDMLAMFMYYPQYFKPFFGIEQKQRNNFLANYVRSRPNEFLITLHSQIPNGIQIDYAIGQNQTQRGVITDVNQIPIYLNDYFKRFNKAQGPPQTQGPPQAPRTQPQAPPRAPPAQPPKRSEDQEPCYDSATDHEIINLIAEINKYLNDPKCKDPVSDECQNTKKALKKRYNKAALQTHQDKTIKLPEKQIKRCNDLFKQLPKLD